MLWCGVLCVVVRRRRAGDGTKECKVKPGWEAILKAQNEPALGATGTGMAVGPGPDGTPVLRDNQAQRSAICAPNWIGLDWIGGACEGAVRRARACT